MSLQDQLATLLAVKASILNLIINENSDDPRIDEPKRQLRIIEEELKFRKNRDKDLDKDVENLVVSLRSLEIRGSSKLER